MNLFQKLPAHVIGQMIGMAKHRAIYAAPSINDSVAGALVEQSRDPRLQVEVILDYDEDLFRLGYGLAESVNMLRDAGINVHKEPGLRIGFVIIDDQGWAFSLPPMAVESQSSHDHINGFELTPEQIERFTQSIGIANKDEDRKESETHHPQAEIGRETLPDQEVSETTTKLNRNPPQAFNLQRQVRVYQSRLQFVEMELEGSKIQQRTIRLPKQLKQSIFDNDQEIEERLNASYKLIDGKASEKLSSLRKEAETLRDRYAPSLGKRLGRVLLSTKKKEFVYKVEDLRERIEKYCKEEQQQLQASIERSLEGLASNLAPVIAERPPQELASRCETVTEEISKEYLLDILWKVAPSAPDLLNKTKLHLTFKDVTLEMLRNPEFQQRVKQEFRYEDWLKPFNEFTAAQSKTDSHQDY
ncbi:hypothetical protein [Marinobacter sp. SS5-14b]|uniref:hypothetical protein n=1 Tax=Marinobacter sp. SS5-14b TaxID=3050456 RepID=UPI0026DF9040|nr:hypothetical protein [Marinobacter sp. SS5-14b]